MATSKVRTAATVNAYLKHLPAECRTAISKVRAVVLDNLPKGYEEGIGWGAITYAIPLETFPDTGLSAIYSASAR
jgi:hypothetical protein